MAGWARHTLDVPAGVPRVYTDYQPELRVDDLPNGISLNPPW